MQRLGFRLGVIAVMAFTIFGIGTFANLVMGVAPAHHESPFQSTQLDAPLSDPMMYKALEEMRNRHGNPSGHLTFPSPDGLVELTENDVYNLNRRYEALTAHEARMASIRQEGEAMERESMNVAGWGSSTEF